jgi:hypothetical protein
MLLRGGILLLLALVASAPATAQTDQEIISAWQTCHQIVRNFMGEQRALPVDQRKAKIETWPAGYEDCPVVIDAYSTMMSARDQKRALDEAQRKKDEVAAAAAKLRQKK